MTTGRAPRRIGVAVVGDTQRFRRRFLTAKKKTPANERV